LPDNVTGRDISPQTHPVQGTCQLESQVQMNRRADATRVSHIEMDLEDVRRINWFGLKPLLARFLAAPIVNPALHGLSRMILPTAIAHRLPLSKDSVHYVLEDGSTVVLLEPIHDAIARDIWHGRGKPTQAAERLKLRVFEQIAKSSKTCLDIGAYAGFFALVAARANPSLRALAFEIVPENFLLTVRNILANDLVDRVDEDSPKLRRGI
jgi:hypothetical protein